MHFLMTLNINNKKMEFQVESFIRSLELLGGVSDYKLTLVLTGNNALKHNIKLARTRINNSFIDKRASVFFSDCHYKFHPPVRWFVKPQSELCIFVDSDVLVCSEIKLPDPNIFSSVIAHQSHYSMANWKKIFERFDVPFPGVLYQSNFYRQVCPYYVNFGLLIVPAEYVDQIGMYLKNNMLDIMNFLSKIRSKNFFSPQVALTLALERLSIPKQDLPLRYNYPDVPTYDKRCPEELENMMFYHYLILKEKFSSRDAIDNFLNQHHRISNYNEAKKILGKIYKCRLL